VSPRQPARQRRLAELLDEHRSILVLLADTRAIPERHLLDPPALLGDEIERFRALRTDKARRRLLASRWLVRWGLSEALPYPPARVGLTRDVHGRPRLPAELGVDLNLSHSRDAVLLGLSAQGRIGVDIEPADRDLVRLGIAGSMFTPVETSRLESLPPKRRNAYMLQTWTLKEARGKLLGTGIGAGFTTFGFTFEKRMPSLVDFAGREAESAAGTYHSWRARGLWIGVAIGDVAITDEPHLTHCTHPSAGPRAQTHTNGGSPR
jgi:4'-phosphopantetheinyl transferase